MVSQRSRAGEDRQAPSAELIEKYNRLSKKYPDQAFAFPQGINEKELKWRGLWDKEILEYRVRHMSKLEEPFPASPTRPPKYGFYVYSDERHVFAFHNFAAMYAARKFLDLMINGRPYRWINDYTIIVDNDLKIRSEAYFALQDVLEYKMKSAEQEWEFPSNVEKSYIHLRDRSTVKIYHPADPDNDASNTRFKNSRGMKEHRADVVAGEKKRAAKPEDSLSIDDAISRSGVKIDASKARACFRKAGLEKPEGGWYFTEATIKDAIKAIKENAK